MDRGSLVVSQPSASIVATIKAVMDKLPKEESHFDEIQEAIKSGEYAKWQKE